MAPPYHQGYAAPGRQLNPHTAQDFPKADAHHHHPPPRQIPPHRKPLNQGGSQFLSLSWQLRRMECAFKRARQNWQRLCSLAGLDEVFREMGQQVGGVQNDLSKELRRGVLHCRGRVSESLLTQELVTGRTARNVVDGGNPVSSSVRLASQVFV